MSDQIISRVLFRPPVTRETVMIIPLGQQLPVASSDTTRERRADHSKMFSYLVLLRMGFTKLFRSPGKLVSSYLAFSPLPAIAGGIFSVALSLGLPPVAVSDHPVLWSSDFPPVRKTEPAII